MTRSRSVALLLAAAVLAGACKKSETRAAGGLPAAGSEVKSPAGIAAPAGGGEPKFSQKAEAGPTPFGGIKPHGIAVDGRGRIYATDIANNRIRVFDSAGASFGGWGSTGDGEYGLKEPTGVAVSGNDAYVCDAWHGRLERFSLDGERKAAAPGFYGPGGVASSGGRVAVSDTGQNQIVLLDADLKNPNRIGKKGSEKGEFSGPAGITIGPSGNVYVADVGNRRIQVFTPEGKFKASWPVPGWARWCLAYIDADSDETIYASDCSSDAVWAFNASGKLVKTIKTSDDGAKFVGPAGVGVDRKNRVLYVAHSGAQPIVKVKLDQ